MGVPGKVRAPVRFGETETEPDAGGRVGGAKGRRSGTVSLDHGLRRRLQKSLCKRRGELLGQCFALQERPQGSLVSLSIILR